MNDSVLLVGQPIFSIDIHPDGSRFATGGQGDGGSSGKVVIWNMTPVCSVEKEKDEKTPKLLCVMENHLGEINDLNRTIIKRRFVEITAI